MIRSGSLTRKVGNLRRTGSSMCNVDNKSIESDWNSSIVHIGILKLMHQCFVSLLGKAAVVCGGVPPV